MKLSIPKFAVNFDFIKKRINLFFFIISAMVNAAVWIFLYIRIKPQSAPIFLHYNIYFGVDLIGEWYKIYYLSGVGLILLFINFIIISLIDEKSEVLGYFLSGITFFLECAVLFSSWLIVRQNI